MLFQLVARFACVGILNSRPGDSREVLVSVSESGFPYFPKNNIAVGIFFCGDISCGDNFGNPRFMHVIQGR